MIRKILSLALCFCLVLCLGAPCASAKSPGSSSASKNTDSSSQTDGTDASGLKLNVKAAVLMEASTGKILYEYNAHEKLAPASITKIMTELLVLEAIESGRLSLTDKITCSEHAASMGGSDIWLEAGETMTVQELFKAMAISSANDAAVALAEKVGGTEKAFVNMMNAKAKELGMNDTNFVNANGLDADGHVTSAYDVALMSRELIKHTEIFDYCTIWMESLRNGKTTLYNTNKLIRFYEGANGLKTGSTGKAGYGMSATAKRSGMQLIAVVLGASSSKERFSAAEDLLDYGFTNWAIATPDIDAKNLKVRVLRGVKSSVEAVTSGTASVLVDKSLENKIVQKVGLVSDVMAPVEKGQILGQIYLTADGKNVGSIPLVAKEAVAKMTFFNAFKKFAKAFLAG